MLGLQQFGIGLAPWMVPYFSELVGVYVPDFPELVGVLVQLVAWRHVLAACFTRRCVKVVSSGEQSNFDVLS